MQKNQYRLLNHRKHTQLQHLWNVKGHRTTFERKVGHLLQEATWDRCRANGKQRECVNSSKITLPLIWYSSSQVDTPIASLKLKRVVKKATPTIPATISTKKILQHYNQFSCSVRTIFERQQRHGTKWQNDPPTSSSQQNTIRRMKFLKTSTSTSPIT